MHETGAPVPPAYPAPVPASASAPVAARGEHESSSATPGGSRRDEQQECTWECLRDCGLGRIPTDFFRQGLPQAAFNEAPMVDHAEPPVLPTAADHRADGARARQDASKALPHSSDGDQAQLHVPHACARKPAQPPLPRVDMLANEAEVAHGLARLAALGGMAESQRQQLSCAYCRWDRQPRHTIKCCLHKPGCCVCGQAHKGRDCDRLPANMKTAQRALQCARARKADANRALHVALAEQQQQVHAEAQRAARAALHTAFSAWREAAGVLVLNVADGDDESAVADGSSAITGTSSTGAGNTSAAADAEPAGTESAGDTGTAGRSSVAIGDASPAAGAVSEGGAAPTTRCCTHALTSFWASQKWQCSTCVCVVPVGTCVQHCAKCDLNYCADCRPTDTEQAAAKLRFQPKERCPKCEALLEHECELPPLIGNRKTPGCSMFWWGCPCRKQFTELCHYVPEVPSQTKANASMANPMQGKWVCDACCTRAPDPNWGPLQLKEFREMQAAFTLSRRKMSYGAPGEQGVGEADPTPLLGLGEPGLVPGASGSNRGAKRALKARYQRNNRRRLRKEAAARKMR